MKMMIKLMQISLLVLSMVPIRHSETQAHQSVAASDLKALIRTEEEIIKSMRNYVKTEKKRIEFLEKYYARSKMEYEIAIKDVHYYFGNPINAYTMIKRLGPDLEYVEDVLKNKTELKTPTAPFPTEEDLMTSALGLSQMLAAYQLNVSQVANGILNTTVGLTGEVFTEITTPMTASDCHSIGMFLVMEKRLTEAIAWLEEAYNKMEDIHCDICPFSAVEVLDNICKAYYELGDKTKYVEWARKRIALRPNDQESLQYESHINILLRLHSRNNIKDNNEIKQNSGSGICLGTVDSNDSSYSKSLSCHYAHGPHPIFTLGPLKVEQLYSNPDLNLFYDVLSDGDVEAIKTLISSRRFNSTRSDLDVYHNAEYVIVQDEASEAVARASRRAAELSGFSREHWESLNVINFGIGRFRRQHRDSRAMNKLDANKQNISATVLFYLSDVKLGGATVFPLLNLTVFPKKGAALFFLNKLPSGEMDLLLVDGNCPVLRGTKWIAVNQHTNTSVCRVWKTEKGIVTDKTYKKILKERQNRRNKFFNITQTETSKKIAPRS